jgi:membrane protein implicated in regulation of membrane protease activity
MFQAYSGAVVTLFASVDIGGLIFAIIVALSSTSLIVFFSRRSGRRLRSEIESERAAQPIGLVGRVESRSKQRLVVLLVLAPVILILGGIAVFSSRNHGSIPAWDGWLIAIIFCGGILLLLIRSVMEKRRRRGSDPLT